MNNNRDHMSQKHLAWHETLEIHELVAFQSIGLLKLKSALPEVKNTPAFSLYSRAIEGLSSNIRDLLAFYPIAPRVEDDFEDDDYRNHDISFYIGDLLALLKTSVRNYAIAITETATPALRKTLKQHLLNAIDQHEAVFLFMEKTGKYPAYNLEKLLTNDMALANRALKK